MSLAPTRERERERVEDENVELSIVKFQSEEGILTKGAIGGEGTVSVVGVVAAAC